MSETPITDAVPHNVPELAMLCRKLERELRESMTELERLRQELALAKRPVIVDTYAAWKEANK